jgi:hypothetical protein
MKLQDGEDYSLWKLPVLILVGMFLVLALPFLALAQYIRDRRRSPR